MTTIDEGIQQAVARTAAGDLSTAAAIYRAVLEAEPEHAGALDALATLELRQGHRHRAVKLLEKLVAVRTDDPAVHLKLAGLRIAFGDHAAAQKLYGRAIALAPDVAAPYGQLAFSLLSSQRFRDAETIAQQALLLDPANIEVRFTLARALAAQGRLSEAAGHLGLVIAERPTAALPHLYLASCAEDPAEAAAGYRRALALDPGLVPLHRLIGEATRRAEGDAAAWADLRRAVERNPDDAEAWAELGAALMAADPQEATRCLDRALALDPTHLGALKHRYDRDQGDGAFETADEGFARLVAALPQRLEQERGVALLAELMHLDAHWKLPGALAEDVARRLDGVLAGRVDAFGALPGRTRTAGPKIRLGYLSENFGDHPIGQVTVSLIPAHDRALVEVHGLSLRDRAHEAQPFAARHQAGFDVFHDLSRLSPRAAAAAIADADIDILIDLDGYVGRRTPEILAYRPAPVQVLFIGHLGGLGLSCVDYLITDRFVVPPGEEGLYRERIVRLPHTMHAADRHAITTPAPTRAAAGLPADGVVFGGFTRANKLDRAIVESWLRILAAVPNSVLWLAAAGGGLNAALRRDAAARGLDPERLVIAPRIDDKADHLARLGLCDLLLDTPAFNAVTGALDALWAGVPVLALKGDRPGNRISASLLTAIGLPELICESREAYEQRAIALARAPAELSALRARLAAQRETAPLFDTQRFARALEAAYLEMWRRYLAGEPAQGFELTPTGDVPKAPSRKRRGKP